MQLRFPFLSPEPPQRVEGTLSIGAGPSMFAVHLVRMKRAKRYIMRLRPDGALRVTIPRGGSRAEALAFAERHLGWAVRQRSRQLAQPASTAVPWIDGTPVLYDGALQPVRVSSRDGRVRVSLADLTVELREAHDDYRAPLVAALRAEATRRLPGELRAVAARHGLEPTRVTVRDQRSRWGSCSSSGAIALNYRLVQMPPAVREYILVHELAHLVHANHSRRFWRYVERLCPEFRAAERWLKVNGRGLF
jgi:predicted metal-dependent hydrolase